jgi:hypothetical protein
MAVWRFMQNAHPAVAGLRIGFRLALKRHLRF